MVLLVAGIALTASAQLNPTVAVLPKPATLVPIECEQGLAPQKMARLDVSQIPEPQTSAADNSAPPSVTLRGSLRDAQTAGEHSDRAAFTDALSRAKVILDSYPNGAERTAATDVVHVFDDVDRVWTYQFDSPTGAFFDGSSPLLATLRAYPGFEAAVAEDVIETGGRKLYPSRESRLFLLRESSRRLARLGVRSGTVIAETSPASDEDRSAHHALPRVVRRVPGAKTTAPASQPKKHVSTASSTTAKKPAATSSKSTTSHTTKHHEKRAAAPAIHTPRPKPVKVAEAAPKPVEKHESAPKHESSPKHEAPPKHETPKQEKAPVPAPATQTVAPPAPMPAPAAATTTSGSMTSPSTATQTSSPAPTTTSATTSSAPDTSTSSTVATTSSATDTTASTASSAAPAPPAPQSSRTRNVVLPILLILVGVGVLVVLFRASS